MKAVLIAYNVALHEEVLEILERLEIEGFTRWERVVGRGRSAGPHLGTHIWPAYNSALLVAADDAKADALFAEIKTFRRRMAREGVKAFVLPVLAATE